MAKPLDPARDHHVSLSSAAAQAKAHRQGGPIRKGDTGAFNAEPIRRLLAQPGCVGVRYYKGRNQDGDDTMILVGVDSTGNDMTSGVLLNIPFLCPPFCPDDDALNT
jgi:hypothetical protein